MAPTTTLTNEQLEAIKELAVNLKTVPPNATAVQISIAKYQQAIEALAKT
jgi:hypothetical protein